MKWPSTVSKNLFQNFKFLVLIQENVWDCAQKLVCKVKGTDRRSCVGILPKTNLKTSQDGYKTKMGIMPKTSLKSSRGKFWDRARKQFWIILGIGPKWSFGIVPKQNLRNLDKWFLGSCPKARLTQYKMYSLSKAETIAIWDRSQNMNF